MFRWLSSLKRLRNLQRDIRLWHNMDVSRTETLPCGHTAADGAGKGDTEKGTFLFWEAAMGRMVGLGDQKLEMSPFFRKRT